MGPWACWRKKLAGVWLPGFGGRQSHAVMQGEVTAQVNVQKMTEFRWVFPITPQGDGHDHRIPAWLHPPTTQSLFPCLMHRQEAFDIKSHLSLSQVTPFCQASLRKTPATLCHSQVKWVSSPTDRGNARSRHSGTASLFDRSCADACKWFNYPNLCKCKVKLKPVCPL